MAESTTFSAPVFTAGGTEREPVQLPAETFDGTVNMPVMHQAVRAFLANQRQGTAATKTRRWVVGGNQKPWRQKGTGRARQGTRRAPHWVGGGTVFGPSPRSYAEYVPRKVRMLARKSALNARARENAIFVIDTFAYDAPRTKRLLELLDSLDVVGRKVLILTDGAKPNVYLSCRNIGWAHVMPYSDVSTYHVLWSDVVVIEAGALGMELEPVVERERAPRQRPKPAQARRAEDEGEEESPRSRKRTPAVARKSKRGGASRSSKTGRAAAARKKATGSKASGAKRSAAAGRKPKRKGK